MGSPAHVLFYDSRDETSDDATGGHTHTDGWPSACGARLWDELRYHTPEAMAYVWRTAHGEDDGSDGPSGTVPLTREDLEEGGEELYGEWGYYVDLHARTLEVRYHDEVVATFDLQREVKEPDWEVVQHEACLADATDGTRLYEICRHLFDELESLRPDADTERFKPTGWEDVIADMRQNGGVL